MKKIGLIVLSVAGLLAAVVLIIALPRGALEGELVTEPVADWSFMGRSKRCQLELVPEDPHSQFLACKQANGRLYVRAILAPNKRWPKTISAHPLVRVKIDEKVYERRAVPATALEERISVLGGSPENPPPETTLMWRLDPR